MRTKHLAGLMVVLLFCITVPAIACCVNDPPGNPACYECKDGAWVLKSGALCGKDSDCGPCRYCGIDPTGVCVCYDVCVACQECVEGSCVSCTALGKVCCPDGWCYPPCVQTNRNICNLNLSSDWPCIGCTVPPFNYCDDFTTRVYTGNKPPWCSGGCPLDCDWVNDVHCYTEYQCTVEEDFLALCSVDPEGPLGVRCKPQLMLSCPHCIRNLFDPGIQHYVTSKECH